eukprot:1134558-Pelagomonas_calceolata.AAC.5
MDGGLSKQDNSRPFYKVNRQSQSYRQRVLRRMVSAGTNSESQQSRPRKRAITVVYSRKHPLSDYHDTTLKGLVP